MAESITLQTSDSNVQQSDTLGRLSFAASNEANTADARLIGASIRAEAEGDFTEISNPTSLIFSTANSESATDKLKITSSGHFIPINNKTYDIGSSSLKFRHIYSEANYSDKLILTSGSAASPTTDTLYNLSGVLYYTDKAVALLPNGGTASQILQKTSDTSYDLQWIDNYATETRVYVKNTTGGALTKGQAVYISGAQGDHPVITLSNASTETTSSKTIGLLKQDLANNEFGYVTTEGLLTGLNTNDAGSAGDSVWLSPSTSGGLVYGLSNKPSTPDHMVFIGYVIRKNANNGIIYIKVQNGFELGELHNVLVNGTSAGKFLQYNDASGLWLASSSGNFTSLQFNGTDVSINGHTHTASNITDFNSSVSGLLPVKNIIAGTNISITSSTGVFTISSSGSGGGGSTEIYEYTSVSGFPSSGTSSILYIATDSSRIYRWENPVYIELGSAGGNDLSLWSAFLPPAPTNLSGVAGNAKVDLTWTAPSVLSQTPITDYYIQYSGATSSSWTTFSHSPSTNASISVTGLTNGTAYGFRVAGINMIGTGTYVTSSSSYTPASNVSLNYLVIGGGGAGGGNTGGGGGAGQVNSGSSTLSVGTVLTATVGNGGTGGTGNGPNGSASSLSATGLSVSSDGGGGGGGLDTSTAANRAGSSVTGGSGGGGGGAGGDGSGAGSGGTGTYNGGTSGSSPGSCVRTGGGGGGSSSNGANASSYTAGNGGDGTTSTITGSSVTYAGGGGGGALVGTTYGCPTHTAGTGGSGGGGGGSLNGNGTAGTQNTGSGGGGGCYTTGSTSSGGNGGKGVVIIRLTGAAASSTTGSPTVTQVGSDYVYQFNGDGTLTL